MPTSPPATKPSDTPQKRWGRFMQLIKTSIGPELFDAWFTDTRFCSLEGNKLTISVASDFVRDLYEDRFSDPFFRALDIVYGPDTEIFYNIGIVEGAEGGSVRVAGSPSARGRKTAQASLHNTSGSDNDQEIPSGLNPAYTFHNYCVGRSNRLAYTIAKSIADHPERTDFNPFFLYGPVGVGKTHLVQAIGMSLKERNPQSRVLFVSMRNFQNQYQVAMLQGKVPDFINFYQTIDVLLIDDIQELSGKKGTIEALFPIFNFLHDSGRKLIFTCDRAPSSLEGIIDRLIDRFKWGSTEMLPKPDLELRKEILRHKAEAGGLQLPTKIIDIIAERVTGSVRELEGVVASLLLRAVALSVPITEDLALQEAQKMMRPRARSINFDMIVDITAECFRINPDVIFSKSKVRDISDARQVIMYVASKTLPLSLSAIGQRLKRSHSTVLHGIRTIENRMSYDHDLSDIVAHIKSELEK